MKPFFLGIMLAMLMGAAMVTDLQNPLEMQVFGID